MELSERLPIQQIAAIRHNHDAIHCSSQKKLRLVWYGCGRNSLLVQTAGLKSMLTPINCHRRCCCCCYCCRLLPLQQQMMIHTGSLVLWPIKVRPSPTTATIRGDAAAAIPSIYQLCRPKNNGYMPSPRRICIARPIQTGSTYRTRHSVTMSSSVFFA